MASILRGKREPDQELVLVTKTQVYPLLCRLSIALDPASVPVRDFASNAEVKLVYPMFGAIAHVTFGNSAEVDWYIKADDLVLKTPAQNSQPHKDVPADKKS